MFPPVTLSQYYFFSEGDSLSISTPVPARPAVPCGGDGSAGQGLPEASAGWCDWTERKGGAKGTYSSHLRQSTPSLFCKAIKLFEPSPYTEHFVSTVLAEVALGEHRLPEVSFCHSHALITCSAWTQSSERGVYPTPYKHMCRILLGVCSPIIQNS